MKILHYGTEQDYLAISEAMENLPLYADQIKYSQYDEYEDFLYALTNHHYNVVIVTADNAVGMEGVIAVKNYRPDLPLVWFSNDSEFGLQSYRLGCTYFGVRPITADKLERAIGRCGMQMRMA